MQRDAIEFSDSITAEENARELAFAVAAGDVPEEANGCADREGCVEEASRNGTLQQNPQGTLSEEGLQAILPTSTGASMPVSSGPTTTSSDVVEETADRGTEVPEGEASATGSMTEGQAEGSSCNSPGSKQTDLKHWLV